MIINEYTPPRRQRLAYAPPKLHQHLWKIPRKGILLSPRNGESLHMIVCGVEIKGKEAILCLVQRSPDGSVHIKSDIKKLALIEERDARSLVNMKSSIEAFAHQNGLGAFVIKTRQSSGILASGGTTFKIEALFQLSGTPVVFVSPPALSAFAKGNLGGVPSSVVGYQADAYRAGAWHLAKT
ncbi:DUF3010 family protein [Plastoroseomonas hellenica]|uniref:DUF3010 family protein n=1 Tax=Plastoroseomonas hellenica TaxID=2687306 RepID=UPI001BA7116F|nr:DUF3010 family protein [Plastoroseomonas hellenica]MBR0644839.1 DUF3010 family protein [Plastoroseomonas hellenica]